MYSESQVESYRISTDNKYNGLGAASLEIDNKFTIVEIYDQHNISEISCIIEIYGLLKMLVNIMHGQFTWYFCCKILFNTKYYKVLFRWDKKINNWMSAWAGFRCKYWFEIKDVLMYDFSFDVAFFDLKIKLSTYIDLF